MHHLFSRFLAQSPVIDGEAGAIVRLRLAQERHFTALVKMVSSADFDLNTQSDISRRLQPIPSRLMNGRTCNNP